MTATTVTPQTLPKKAYKAPSPADAAGCLSPSIQTKRLPAAGARTPRPRSSDAAEGKLAPVIEARAERGRDFVA
eukprot:CAMPEP_0173447312 /NCGR_PEP_ID=MMETSP1357-20121228/38440_1 /TAXON_ID=77926 /ORGANISM="Hemiselmis rufescens, Strain PCC563" /LENGTH=73 /DNA_ID=CAMNT_0014413689 /DNA_START=51 /DNA_END=272 /DNA_ORIENTATION=+